MGTFSAIAGLYVFSSYKTFGGQNIDDDEFLALVGSLASICNAVSRLF